MTGKAGKQVKQTGVYLHKYSNKQITRAVKEHDRRLMWNDHLGFISEDLFDIGTGLSIVVRMHLPHLMADSYQINDVMSRLGLQHKNTGIK